MDSSRQQMSSEANTTNPQPLPPSSPPAMMATTTTTALATAAGHVPLAAAVGGLIAASTSSFDSSLSLHPKEGAAAKEDGKSKKDSKDKKKEKKKRSASEDGAREDSQGPASSSKAPRKGVHIAGKLFDLASLDPSAAAMVLVDYAPPTAAADDLSTRSSSSPAVVFSSPSDPSRLHQLRIPPTLKGGTPQEWYERFQSEKFRVYDEKMGKKQSSSHQRENSHCADGGGAAGESSRAVVDDHADANNTNGFIRVESTADVTAGGGGVEDEPTSSSKKEKKEKKSFASKLMGAFSNIGTRLEKSTYAVNLEAERKIRDAHRDEAMRRLAKYFPERNVSAGDEDADTDRGNETPSPSSDDADGADGKKEKKLKKDKRTKKDKTPRSSRRGSTTGIAIAKKETAADSDEERFICAFDAEALHNGHAVETHLILTSRALCVIGKVPKGAAASTMTAPSSPSTSIVAITAATSAAQSPAMSSTVSVAGLTTAGNSAKTTPEESASASAAAATGEDSSASPAAKDSPLTDLSPAPRRGNTDSGEEEGDAASVPSAPVATTGASSPFHSPPPSAVSGPATIAFLPSRDAIADFNQNDGVSLFGSGKEAKGGSGGGGSNPRHSRTVSVGFDGSEVVTTISSSSPQRYRDGSVHRFEGGTRASEPDATDEEVQKHIEKLRKRAEKEEKKKDKKEKKHSTKGSECSDSADADADTLAFKPRRGSVDGDESSKMASTVNSSAIASTSTGVATPAVTSPTTTNGPPQPLSIPSLQTSTTHTAASSTAESPASRLAAAAGGGGGGRSGPTSVVIVTDASSPSVAHSTLSAGATSSSSRLITHAIPLHDLVSYSFGISMSTMVASPAGGGASSSASSSKMASFRIVPTDHRVGEGALLRPIADTVSLEKKRAGGGGHSRTQSTTSQTGGGGGGGQSSHLVPDALQLFVRSSPNSAANDEDLNPSVSILEFRKFFHEISNTPQTVGFMCDGHVDKSFVERFVCYLDPSWRRGRRGVPNGSAAPCASAPAVSAVVADQ